MTRDLSLLRRLLLAAEDRAPVNASELFADVPYEQVIYHVQLLRGAGYLDLIDQSTLRMPKLIVTGLTWKGHDTAGLIRDDSRWHEITSRIGAAMVPFDLIERLAYQLAKQDLGILELTTAE